MVGRDGALERELARYGYYKGENEKNKGKEDRYKNMKDV